MEHYHIEMKCNEKLVQLAVIIFSFDNRRKNTVTNVRFRGRIRGSRIYDTGDSRYPAR